MYIMITYYFGLNFLHTFVPEGLGNGLQQNNINYVPREENQPHKRFSRSSNRRLKKMSQTNCMPLSTVMCCQLQSIIFIFSEGVK